MAWQRRRILIWGKTRPELSQSYRETVCTGGVFADDRKFVRLYPIPLRYLDDEKVFKKYQWITADVEKSTCDLRPESYKIRYDSIVPGETIPTKKGNWDERAAWITEPPGHVFRSVESLLEARKEDGTSIGMVKPAEVSGVMYRPYPQRVRDEFAAKYRDIMGQLQIPFSPEDERTIRMLPAPEFRFRIKFRCDDPACPKEHVFTVFDWEVDALYNNCRREGDSREVACEKVAAELRDKVCGKGKDTHFFLGNIAQHPLRFTIVGLWYPKLQAHKQLNLFTHE
jgi:hypothetical protein